jgi:hypothetical protein
MSHLSMEELVALREPGLEPGDAAAREHLQTCLQCRAEMERLHQRVARLKALPALMPARNRWPQVETRLLAERRRHRARNAGLAGLAAAASIALGLALSQTSPSPDQLAQNQQIQEAMRRSQALESELSQYNPESRVLDGRTAGIAQELEDRIAQVDRELEMADLQDQDARDAQLLQLWRERVGLLDALVDVHVTRASNVGL